MSDWLDSQADDTGDFGLVPDGDYRVMIERIEVRQTKAKAEGRAQKGELVSIMFDIIDDAQAGRKLFEQFNVSHDNEKAQQIGRGQFGRMVACIGAVLKIQDPPNTNWQERKDILEAQLQPLQDKVVGIRVANKFDDWKKEQVNFIKKFIAKDDIAATVASRPKGQEPTKDELADLF